jgi:cap1 methyltransferase
MMSSSHKRARTLDEDSDDSSSSADYYYAVFSGAETGILSSWFRVMEWTGHGFNSYQKNDSSLEDLRLEIRQLTRQLIEVKRRMIGGDHYRKARRASNPYEFLGEGQNGGLNLLFMNRSAIKLANLDALLDWQLTMQPNFGPFRFVDLCGAPGGFSEYLMRRCVNLGVHECHGFGMSLLGVNEYGAGVAWKIGDFCDYQQRTKLRYQVCWDGSGDILDWSNVQELIATISKDSETSKVQLVVADGGFDAQRNAEDQEGMTQKLIVCEVAAALELLDIGGTLVLKLFGFQTPVVQCVMRYLYASFERMVALKPISSRPASAERYVVFVNFRGNASNFDGQRWKNQMFLGQFVADVPTEELDSYLCEFDRNMLVLNLKACHTMLSYVKSEESWDVPELSVDADDYRLCWRLM